MAVFITRRSTLALLATASATSVRAETAEIVLGVPMALSGPYAFVGVPIRNGIVGALEDANTAGTLGEARIKVIAGDTASDKTQAVSLTNRMASVDRVLMMLGPTSSIEGTAAAPVANELKLPMFTTAVSDDVLKAGPWSFKVTSAPSDIMAELGRYAVKTLGRRRVAFVFNRDNDGFVGQKNVLRNTMRAEGATVVSEDGILGSDTDFVALSTKLAGTDVDAIFIGSPAEQGANIVIQARQAGLDDKVIVLAPPSMASAAYIKTGGAAVEGSVLVADYFEGGTSDANKQLVAAYRKRYGQAPDNWAAVGYTLGSMAVRVIKAAAPLTGDLAADRERVRAAFATLKDIPTALGRGTYSLDAQRAPHYGAALVRVKNGAFVEAG